jgi:hypothetical protein
MFKRTRYQFGSVERKGRKKGPDVWALRYREHMPDGTSCHKSLIVGTVEQHATKSQARRAAQAFLLGINVENPNTGEVGVELFAGEEVVVECAAGGVDQVAEGVVVVGNY